jgi:hypothetical protein
MSAHEVEYFSAEELAASTRLAGATGELISNWMQNNRGTDPYIVLAALGRLMSVSINECKDPDARIKAVTFVIHLMLGETDVDHRAVLRAVSLLTAGNAEGGFDA